LLTVSLEHYVILGKKSVRNGPCVLAARSCVLSLQFCRTVNKRLQTAFGQWETGDNGLGKMLRVSIRNRQFCCR